MNASPTGHQKGAPRRARVVVTTFDRPRHLALAAAAWLRQTADDFALTVADDGSGPETAEVVRAWAREAPYPVDHVRWEHQGFRRGGILNEAVRRSAGEPLLVFTDGDCLPPADFLAQHLRAHRPRGFSVGGMARIGPARSAALTEAEVRAGGHEALPTRADRRKARRHWWKSRIGLWLRRPHRPKCIGANVGIDRALFEEVNGYDESFVGWGLEDDDLRDRVMATRPRPRPALLFRQCLTVHVWHEPAPTLALNLNRSRWESERPTRCVHGLVDERVPRPADRAIGRALG